MRKVFNKYIGKLLVEYTTGIIEGITLVGILYGLGAALWFAITSSSISILISLGVVGALLGIIGTKAIRKDKLGKENGQ